MKLQGPMKDRRCTDLIFTILFLLFCGGFGYVCNEGFTKGKPNELLSPVDFDGKLCGVDYPDHPFLYFIVNVDDVSTTGEASIEFNAVCVSTCPPKNTTTPIDCKTVSTVTADNCAKRMNLTTYTPTTGYVGYGTKGFFNKFCVPNLDQLPYNTTKINIDAT